MKKIFLIFITSLFFLTKMFAQDSLSNKNFRVRNYTWSTPVSKNTITNGVAIGFMAIPWMKADYLKINGLNIEVSPFGVFAGPMVVLGSIFLPLNPKYYKDTLEDEAGDLAYNIFPVDDGFRTEIKGCSFSAGGLVRETSLNGFGVNGLICFANNMHGCEITGIMNLHYEFKGVMIAGLRNKVTKGKGIQIGLFNTCKDGSVLQIGLLNRIGKRITPFINFKFKKKK